jgi:hypothetical protein
MELPNFKSHKSGVPVVVQKFNNNNNNTKARHFCNKKFSCMSSAGTFVLPFLK